MKTTPLLVSFALCASALLPVALNAADMITVTDDFNRPNGPLGANWAPAAPDGRQLSIVDGEAVNTNGGVNFLWVPNVIDSSAGFTLSVDVAVSASKVWAGFVFNVQDAGNFQGLRFRDNGIGAAPNVQMWRVTDGTEKQVFAQGVSGATNNFNSYTLEQWVTFTVSSVEPHKYLFTIINRETSGLLFSYSYTDTSESLLNGRVGVYVGGNSSNTAYFDNFSFTTVPGIPEPGETAAVVIAAICGVTLWARRRVRAVSR